MVLYVGFAESTRVTCGDSLITSRVVLTVAHCFSRDPSKLFPYIVGLHRYSIAYSARSENECSSNIGVARVVLHPASNKQAYQNDAAVQTREEDAPCARTNTQLINFESSDRWIGRRATTKTTK
eukprot:6188964-Pleurochrysis_carterae.AAC.1